MLVAKKVEVVQHCVRSGEDQVEEAVEARGSLDRLVVVKKLYVLVNPLNAFAFG